MVIKPCSPAHAGGTIVHVGVTARRPFRHDLAGCATVPPRESGSAGWSGNRGESRVKIWDPWVPSVAKLKQLFSGPPNRSKNSPSGEIVAHGPIAEERSFQSTLPDQIGPLPPLTNWSVFLTFHILVTQ